jgi:hypothetical protein
MRYDDNCSIPISGTPIDDGDYPDINNFPQIIWDALKAALRIDILYLWVDRYRINQSDAHEKQHQINGYNLRKCHDKIISASTNRQYPGLPGVLEACASSSRGSWLRVITSVEIRGLRPLRGLVSPGTERHGAVHYGA